MKGCQKLILRISLLLKKYKNLENNNLTPLLATDCNDYAD